MYFNRFCESYLFLSMIFQSLSSLVYLQGFHSAVLRLTFLNFCHYLKVCNSIGQCHCNEGFGPPFCNEPGYGGSTHSGPIKIKGRSSVIERSSVIYRKVICNRKVKCNRKFRCNRKVRCNQKVICNTKIRCNRKVKCNRKV